MHADFPPDIYESAGTLNEERDADDCHQEMRHVSDGEDVHQAEVATDVDNVGNDAFVSLAKLESAPAMKAAIDEDAQSWQTECKDIDEPENPKFEAPREEAQVGETQQDDGSDSRVIRRTENCR